MNPRNFGRISIHAPLAGCDYILTNFNTTIEISIHAPLAGCDQVVIIYIKICVHFNPRTPCGVRLVTSHDVFDVAAISIHAPLAGCDAQHDGRDDAHDHFNPRTPCGVRRERAVEKVARGKFQSTHPLRGATTTNSKNAHERQFQSTHPLRGATQPNVVS